MILFVYRMELNVNKTFVQLLFVAFHALFVQELFYSLGLLGLLAGFCAFDASSRELIRRGVL